MITAKYVEKAKEKGRLYATIRKDVVRRMIKAGNYNKMERRYNLTDDYAGDAERNTSCESDPIAAFFITSMSKPERVRIRPLPPQTQKGGITCLFAQSAKARKKRRKYLMEWWPRSAQSVEQLSRYALCRKKGIKPKRGLSPRHPRVASGDLMRQAKTKWADRPDDRAYWLEAR